MNPGNQDSAPATERAESDLLRLIRELRRTSSSDVVQPSDMQGRLVKALESVIVNRKWLHNHIRRLQSGDVERPQSSCDLSPSRLEDVLTNGLQDLGLTELLSLTFEAVALRRIHDEVVRKTPTAWLSVLEREGAAWLRQHGRTIRPADQITKCAEF